jgi:hypothetical protein
MSVTALFKMLSKIVFLTLAFSLYGCIYTKSGNKNFNRTIEITATFGKAYIDISGHISEDIYAYRSREDMTESPAETPIVAQGKRTISKQIVLNATEQFKYTLTTAEVVIINIKSIDGDDVIITVSEPGENKEYKIDGKNRLGQTITLRN